MSPRWSPVVLLAALALALAACARPHHTRVTASQPQPPQVLQYSYRSHPAITATSARQRPSQVLDYPHPAPRALVASPPRVLQYPVETPQPRIAQPVAVPIPVAQGGPYVAERPYTLDSGDRLRIIVFGQQNLSTTYTVDASGKIAVPLIGSVTARGLTPQQLAQSIAADLRRGFMRDPSVTAEIVSYRPFFILGEVNNPGQYPYVAHMTVETAVAIAGGYSPRGSKDEVKISRTVNGATTRFKAPVTFRIRPGDTIRVQERWF